jgi:Domain of unknown function (DUF4403)
MRKIFIGAVIFVAFFAIALRAMDALWPPEGPKRPPVATMPRLAPMTKSSFLIAPVRVADSAIQEALEAAAPRDLAGKRDNPVSALLSKAEIGWTMTRGPLGVGTRSDAIAVSTALNGTLRLTGQVGAQVGAQVGNLTGRIAGFAGAEIGNAVQNLAGKAFDQKVELRGNIAVLSRPSLTPGWRLEPNLSSQVAIADVSLPISGNMFNVAREVRPLVERAVAENVAALQTRIRNDPAIEQAARREWAKMCRSISLKNAVAGMPDLWLEMRPVRAFAAQPRVEPQAVNLVLGVEAETRVIPGETRPDCPFPVQVELVPPIDRGRISIGLAIDVPFTEVNRLLEAQIKGRNFPDDGSGAVAATIEAASLQGAGDRLLIALKVRARETRSWFGFGGLADVFVWGRATLDRDNQILRLTDITIDVESESAMGLLGAAARAALPYLQSTLAERATIDLKPLAASARQSLEAAVNAFTRQEPGVQVDAAISDLRLTDIAFDAATLRLVAEVDGAVAAGVTELPK